eukprot:9067623-Pyramimonas_sp.AAC.1
MHYYGATNLVHLHPGFGGEFSLRVRVTRNYCLVPIPGLDHPRDQMGGWMEVSGPPGDQMGG